jgi:hypothetical protein
MDLYLVFLNKKHSRQREALGKSAVVVDESMMTKNKIETNKAVELEDVNEIRDQSVTDNGFSDMTDLRNEDFIYVY